MEVALIINPFASAVSRKSAAAVEAELARAGTVTALPTERRGHATALAAEAASADALVVFSGDGGYNEALNGVPRPIPLGFVPGGRTNVLPRSLGLPREPVEAARQIANALAKRRTRTISLGRVNGRRFSFSAGIGPETSRIWLRRLR
jgi:diacylglycerol kinase family enzyme